MNIELCLVTILQYDCLITIYAHTWLETLAANGKNIGQRRCASGHLRTTGQGWTLITNTLTTAQEGKTSSEQTLHSSAKPSFLPDQLAHRDRPRWYESLMSGGGHRKWGHAPYWTVNIAGRSGVTGFLCDDRVLATHTHTIRRARFHSCPK